MKNYLISIDDTDDVTKRVSTGQIAEIIGRRLTEAGGKVGDGISRHQLLLSDEIAVYFPQQFHVYRCGIRGGGQR